LFGQNAIVPPFHSDGENIEHLRRELGIAEPFPLFRRYREYCQMKGSNVPGEPKLAMEFLKELGVDVLNIVGSSDRAYQKNK